MTSLQKLKKQIIQSLLFVLLIVVFVVCLILAILSSQGNAINKEGDVISTGIVKLFITPQVSYIASINGEEVNVNSDRIEWINPGVIKLSIQATGYKVWSKEIVVQEGVVHDVYVQLIPENLNIEQLTATSIKNVVFSKDGTIVYFFVSGTEDSQENGLWRLRLTKSLLNLVRNEPQRMLSESAFPEGFDPSEWEFQLSYDNSQLLFISQEKKQILIFDINNQSLKTFYPNVRLSSMPSEIFFFNGGSSLILLTEFAVYEYNLSIDRFNLITEISENISFVVGYDEVYIVDRKHGRLFVYKNQQTKEFSEIFVDDVFLEKIKNISIKNVYLAESKDRDNILIQDDSERLFFVDLKNKEIIGLDITSPIKISPSGRLIIGRSLNGETISVLVESKQGGRKNSLTQYTVDLGNIVSDIFISRNEKILLYFKSHPNGSFSLIRQDVDGTNKLSLIDLSPDSYFLKKASFSVDNTELYLIINTSENNIEEQTNPKLNLHKISLV